MLFKKQLYKELKGAKELGGFKFKTILFALLQYVALKHYSNCFEIISTVAFLVSQTRLI